MSQHLAAIHSGEVEVEQDQIRARRIGVRSFAPKKGHSLRPVSSHVQTDGWIGVAERFLRQPDVTGTVFDQKNVYSHATSSDDIHVSPLPRHSPNCSPSYPNGPPASDLSRIDFTFMRSPSVAAT